MIHNLEYLAIFEAQSERKCEFKILHSISTAVMVNARYGHEQQHYGLCVFFRPFKVTANQVQWSIKYSKANSCIRWLNGESLDDVNRDVCRNIGLLAIQPPDVTASLRIFVVLTHSLPAI